MVGMGVGRVLEFHQTHTYTHTHHFSHRYSMSNVNNKLLNLIMPTLLNLIMTTFFDLIMTTLFDLIITTLLTLIMTILFTLIMTTLQANCHYLENLQGLRKNFSHITFLFGS